MADEWVDAPADDWQDVAPAAPPLAQLQPSWLSDPVGKIVQLSRDLSMGGDEAAANAASSMAAAIPAGAAGLGHAIAQGNPLGLPPEVMDRYNADHPQSAADVIGDVQDKFTYHPETESGQRASEALNEVLGIPAKAGGYLGEKTLDVTGSPAAAAAVDTAVQFLGPALLGARAKGGHGEVVEPKLAAPEAVPEVVPEAAKAPDMQAAIDAGNADPLLGKRPETPIRLYHGGEDIAPGDTRFLTPSEKYARGYATKDGRTGGKVFYVDVAADHPEVIKAGKAFDDSGTSVRAPINHFEASPELTSQLKELRPEPTPRQSQEYSLNQSFLRDEGGHGYDPAAPDTKVELKDHGFSEPEIADMADKGMAHPDGTMDREQFWNWKNDTPADKAPDTPVRTIDAISPATAEDLKARGYSDASIQKMSVDDAREVLGLPGDLDTTLDPKTKTYTRALLEDPETAPEARAWLEQNAHDPEQVKAALEHAAAKHEELEPHVYPTEDVPQNRGSDVAGEKGQPASPDEIPQTRPREGEPVAREAPAPGVAETERPAGAASRIATDSVSEPLREVSARNAAIDAHREAMGLEPLPVAERKSFETSAQQARDMLTRDPAAPQRIVAEHTATGRALSDPEQLVLAEHSAKLGREHEAATAEINRAREAGDQPAGAIATLRRESIENEARGVHKALNEGGGTANARGLAIRNAILKDDYSVGRNMARAEAHYSGLNDRLRSQARELTEHIKKSQDELERMQAQVEKERAAKPAERPAREAKRPQSADEREQVRIEKKIAQLKSDIERRLKACPV